MLTKWLHITEYDENGWNWKTEEIRDPTWHQIEASVRRLDKFRFPFVWLYLTEDNESIPEFEICGGSGDYAIACSIQGYHQRLFCEPSLGNDEIVVWTSDQGGSNAAKNVLHDINVVLRVTKFFCETGDFDPSIPWDNSRPPKK